jgi:hypothetical protein
MKIHLVGAKLHTEKGTDGRTERHDDANSRFQNVPFESKYKRVTSTAFSISLLSSMSAFCMSEHLQSCEIFGFRRD